MKKLVVFGDSFQSTSYIIPGTHWSEILSVRNGLELINLANAGCSTRYIVFQILHAMLIDNCIVVGSHAAHPSRVELLTKEHFVDHSLIDIRSFENFYDAEDNDGRENAFLKTLNLFTILSDDSVPAEDKTFLMTKLSTGLFEHIDRWGIFYALSKLKSANKDFVYLANLLPQSTLIEDFELVNAFGKKHIMTIDELNFNDYYVDKHATPGFFDPGYHTSPNSQFIIADKIEKKLKDNGLL